MKMEQWIRASLLLRAVSVGLGYFHHRYWLLLTHSSGSISCNQPSLGGA